MFTTFHQLGTLESIKHSCETLGLKDQQVIHALEIGIPMATPHLQFTLHWLLATLCKGLDHAQGPRCGPSWCLIPCDGSFRLNHPNSPTATPQFHGVHLGKKKIKPVDPLVQPPVMVAELTWEWTLWPKCSGSPPKRLQTAYSAVQYRLFCNAFKEAKW